MAHCKICRGYLSNPKGELCDYCSTAKTTVEETIGFLESFLDNPTDANPINGVWGALEFLNYFLGMYNRYSGLKNLIFEIELNTLMDHTDGNIHVQELANRDAFLKLDRPKQMKLIQAFSEHGIFDIEHQKDSEVDSISFIIGRRLKKGNEILILSDDPTDENYRRYNQSISLLVMLLLINLDLSTSIRDDYRGTPFPRIGFVPLRLISGAINRKINEDGNPAFVTSEEITRSFYQTGRNSSRLVGSLYGIYPNSTSIFQEIPDPDSTDPVRLAQPMDKFVELMATRIRTRDYREREDRN
jgi:hypothetical protein